MQTKTSPVALHGKDRSIHMLRVVHGENCDKIAAKSFLPQQKGSLIHGLWDSLVQQLPKMQRKAWQRNPSTKEWDINISKYPTGNTGLQKAGVNQSLTFLVLCSSAPPHWVKWLLSPPICLSCSPSCSRGSDQKLQLSLQVTFVHCEFCLLQRADLVEEERELSFFSLRNKRKKKINNFSCAKYKHVNKKNYSFSHNLRLF